MENVYTAYTREINHQTFYFVKKYISFPEMEDAQVLDGYGMHADFYQACSIAEIQNERVINNLLDQLQMVPLEARVVSMERKSSIKNSLFHNMQQVILKLRLAGIH